MGGGTEKGRGSDGVGGVGLVVGTCGVGAFDREALDALFQLDGEEEFFAYTEPVGRIAKADEEKEAAFYAHLKKK